MVTDCLTERGIMAPDTVDYSKGESPMTDMQFAAYTELRDKYEALLLEAAGGLSIVPSGKSDLSFSDYQFKRFEQVRDKCEELGSEIAALRKENSRLKLQVELLQSSYKVTRL